MAAPKRKRFQLTSLPCEDRKRLAGYIKQLGAILIDTQFFSKLATHVICGKANRGEKYLGGCSLGKWVLQKEFVEDSFKQGGWLDEEQYEWVSSVLDPKASKELGALYDAPRKWRLALQTTRTGAFKTWNTMVHVKDIKMKKAYERLLEVGDAVVSKKKVSFQDKSSLPTDLTCIFVEDKLRSDVIHLQSHGISVLSPDYIPEYIIKGPTSMTTDIIMKNDNMMNTYKTSEIKKITKSVVSMSGKENGHMDIETNAKEHSMKRGVKRTLTECDLCAAKKQKTMELPPYINLNSTQDITRAHHLIFPGYVSNMLESCMEEECLNLGVESVTSSLSSKQAPTSRWLHVLMNHFLLNASTEQQALRSYHLLQSIMHIHPPSACQNLYLDALQEPMNEGSQNVDKSTPWQFVSKVIRNAIGKREDETLARTQQNARLLLRVFDILFISDGYSCATESTSIISRILWPGASICQPNTEIKEYVALCCEAMKFTADDDTEESFTSHILFDWLSMAVTLKRRDDVTACEAIAQQLFMEICKANCFEITKLLLQGCRSFWLKTRILELILENYDKRLIPQKHKQLLNKTIKLNRIVMCYFFLMPNNTKERALTNDTVDRKSCATKKIRKNGKGETPLHLACIQNDAAKVEEILKQGDLDVNVQDNAGWTALHEACNRGHIQCVKKILQYHETTNKVNLLATPHDGLTVLHDAVINNHLPVVKLLTKAGGLTLLDAKTTSGNGALQLAGTHAMSEFLQSEINKLRTTHDHKDMSRPSQEAYNKVLSINGGKSYVSMQECEKFLFYVSLLVQAYVGENAFNCSHPTTNQKTFCTNCIADIESLAKFTQHLSNLEQHVRQLCGNQHLSPSCKLYISSMKLCIPCTD